jgi:hypothetical protein
MRCYRHLDEADRLDDLVRGAGCGGEQHIVEEQGARLPYAAEDMSMLGKTGGRGLMPYHLPNMGTRGAPS